LRRIPASSVTKNTEIVLLLPLAIIEAGSEDEARAFTPRWFTQSGLMNQHMNSIHHGFIE
jgi:hypothetical protein